MKHVILAFITLFALNSITHANVVPAEKLFKSPYVSMPKLSSDGRYVSNYVNHEDTLYFTITDLEIGQQFIVQGMDDVKNVSRYQWIDNETLHFSTYRKDFFVDLTYSTETISAEVKEVRYNGYVVHVFPESKQVLFAKLRPWEEGGFDLHVSTMKILTDVKLNEKKHLAPPNKNVSFFSYDKKSKRIIAKMAEEKEKSITFQYRTLEDPTWITILELNDVDYEIEFIGFFDDNTIGVLTDKESDRVAFHKYDIQKKELSELIYEHPRFDLLNAQMLQFGQIVEPLSVTYIDHGKYKIEYLQKSQEDIAQQLTKAFNGRQWRILSHSIKTDQYIIYAFDSDSPGSFYLFTPKLKKAELLFEEYPELDGLRFAKTEVNTIHVEEGVDVETYMTRAIGHRLNTLLVMPHGGPIGVRETATFNKEVQFLASRGFDVLQVNFRGSKGFGKSFKSMAVGELGRAIEKDISAAVNNVLKNNQYQNVCSIGASYGGYSSMMLAIKHPETYDCIVARFGVYDLPLLYDSNNIRLHFGKEVFDELLGGDDEKLYDVSPVYLAHSIQSPILLTAGKADEIAVFEQSRRMEYVLKQLKKDSTSIFYDYTGHGHPKWDGDIHENVSIYDFLMESLNLAVPSDISEENKTILARDFELVGDGYVFTDTVPNDQIRAKKFYRKAAELGNAKAMNNYAWMLSQSKENDPDAQNMLEWFIKAEEAGFGQASFILAELYQIGKYVEKDLSKAYEKFVQAEERGFGDRAKYEVARAQCLGLGTPKDFESCIEVLKERDVRQAEFDEKQKLEPTPVESGDEEELITGGEDLLAIFGKLFLSDQLSAEEYKRLKNQFMYEYQIDRSELTLNVQTYGEFSNFKHLRETTQIDSENSNFFGVEFKLRSSDVFSSSEEQIALIYTWTIIDEKGNEVSKKDNIFRGGRGTWSVVLPIENVTIKPSKYKIKIYDIDKNMLYEETFDIR